MHGLAVFEGGAGSEVVRLLEEEKLGHVAAVHERAAYVKTLDNEVVFFSQKPLTPYSVYLGSSWDALKTILRKGVEVSFGDGEVIVGDMVFIELEGVGFPAPLPPCRPPAEMVKTALSVLTLLDDGVLNLREIVEGTAAVRTLETGDVLNSLMPLIGRGPGATPAADDFAAGVLLAYHAAGLSVDTGPLTARAELFSRWPSWKMLEHAGHGCTFVQVNNLHRAMCRLDAGLVFEHIVETVRIGSSTGICLLKGFLETLMRLT